MRRLSLLAALVLVAIIAAYAWALWRNNRDVPPPPRAELAARLERATGWLETHMSPGGDYRHPQLWWMIRQAAAHAGSPRLLAFYRLHAPYLRSQPTFAVWSGMFDDTASVQLPPPGRLPGLPAYDYLLLYGLTCDAGWGRALEVTAQLRPDFCSAPIREPQCNAFQLLGVRLVQRNGCGDRDRTAALLGQLQDDTVTWLIRDPRVDDAYILRVLVLLDSGAFERVRPAWIRRILAAQLSDGGWGDVQPVLRLPDDSVLGFTSAGLVHRRLHSDFHATAKAVLLLGLLLESRHP